jgi:hypothetical protein
MRIHEILGVEPGEVFTINTLNGKYAVNPEGMLIQVFGETINNPCEADAFAYRRAINDGIIRKPRLTAEQKYALEAIYKVFGMRWLVYDAKSDIAYASKLKPERHRENESWMVPGPKMDLWVSITLVNLASSTEPLDIEQTLRDAGA